MPFCALEFSMIAKTFLGVFKIVFNFFTFKIRNKITASSTYFFLVKADLSNPENNVFKVSMSKEKEILFVFLFLRRITVSGSGVGAGAGSGVGAGCGAGGKCSMTYFFACSTFLIFSALYLRCFFKTSSLWAS